MISETETRLSAPFGERLGALKAMLQEGRPDAALAAGEALLSRHPGDARLHLMVGQAQAKRGWGDEAEARFVAARGLGPADPTGHAEAGVALMRLERIDSAKAQFDVALAQDEACAVAWKGLGALHLRQKDPAAARNCFTAASAHAPRDAEAAAYLGVALEKLDDVDGARAAIDHALSLDPDEAASRHAAFVLDATGAPERAAKLIADRFSAGPQGALTLRLLMNAFVQMPEFFGAPARFWAEAERLALKTRRPGLIVSAAIGWMLLGRPERVLALLTGPEAAQLPQRIEALRRTDPAGARFAGGYFGFLRARLAEMRPAPPWAAEARPLFHIGESHCLSFAHEAFEHRGERRRIAPRLCLGAKAFHLGAPRPTAAKAILARHLGKLPHGAEALLSFGEIDCRLDEGILDRHRKTGAPIEAIAEATAAGYVRFLVETIGDQELTLHLLGAPAPRLRPDASAADRDALIETVRRFNQALAGAAADAGLGFVDLYAFTAGPDGAGDERWHLDLHHLRAAALPEILARL